MAGDSANASLHFDIEMARTAFHWILGATLLLLVAEVTLRVLPVSTSSQVGYYIDPVILTYPPHHSWTVANSWDLRNSQSHRSNNAGFVADHDFQWKPEAVALIGDSLVESAMLSAPDRPGAQLEKALNGRPVFAMGGPGSSLLDYAERIRYASERLGVRDFVVLMERWDLRQSLCGSGNIHGPCIDGATLVARTETMAPPSLVKRILRHSALMQYVFGQLKVTPARLMHSAIAQARPVTPTMSEMVAARPKRWVYRLIRQSPS